MNCNCEFDPDQRPVSICKYHDEAFKFTAKMAMLKERTRTVEILKGRAAMAQARGLIDLAVALSGYAKEIEGAPKQIYVAVLDPGGRNLIKP